MIKQDLSSDLLKSMSKYLAIKRFLEPGAVLHNIVASPGYVCTPLKLPHPLVWTNQRARLRVTWTNHRPVSPLPAGVPLMARA